MIAVIQTGGKQYTVKAGDVLRVEKLVDAEVGKTISFSDVLLVSDESGKSTVIGNPLVAGATVEATVKAAGRAKKLLVKKFKAKSRYARTYGHRQPFTEIEITTITTK